MMQFSICCLFYPNIESNTLNHIEMWFCTIIDMFLDFKTSYVVYYLQLIRSFLCAILDYKIEKEKRIPIKLLRFLFITSSAYITNQMYFCCPKNILQLSNFNMYFYLHELHVHIFTCYDSIQFFSDLVLMLLIINVNNI